VNVALVAGVAGVVVPVV